MLLEFHTHPSEWGHLSMRAAAIKRDPYANHLNYLVFLKSILNTIIVILQSFYTHTRQIVSVNENINLRALMIGNMSLNYRLSQMEKFTALFKNKSTRSTQVLAGPKTHQANQCKCRAFRRYLSLCVQRAPGPKKSIPLKLEFCLL